MGEYGALIEGVCKKFGGYTDNSSVEVLNLNAKVYAQLSEDQSLYFKGSGQFEYNQASHSSQTPSTFDTDPTQNPLDADRFTMRRYGMDIIHKWLTTKRLSLTARIYASDFERDWWRQTRSGLPSCRSPPYLGDEIFADRCSYLSGRTFGEEDYVIVGWISGGLEGTTDSRWMYRVSGLKETLEHQWGAFGQPIELEVGLDLHRETFKDVLLRNDTFRLARTGVTTVDLRFRLWSANAYLRNSFKIDGLGILPILRFVHVDRYRQNLIALAVDPNLQGTDGGKETNVYDQFLPGIALEHPLGGGELYLSVHKGMMAPSKVFGFLVEQDGVVTNPLAGGFRQIVFGIESRL